MSIGVPVAAVLALAISASAPHMAAAQAVCNNPTGPVSGQACQTIGETKLSQDCISILGCLLDQQTNTIVWAQFMSTSAIGGVTGGCEISVNATENGFYAGLALVSGTIQNNWGQGCQAAGTSVTTCASAASSNYNCGMTGSYNNNPATYYLGTNVLVIFGCECTK